MPSDRWRQIEDLCHAALARPTEERSAFLESACQGDAALRREVESLLAHEASVESFMSVPAAAVTGAAGLAGEPGTLAGGRFGSYAIRSLLGVGGMGEVYRAYDEALGREIAIKVLSPAFTSEPERRARFEREARMLAALNHPHIGAIYGVEEVHGVRGLVLELVEGDTLAERIARRARASADQPGLPIDEALTIARQIADALEAAHEKGVVHRDLKPANIKITPGGMVKVLDFGLAKIAGLDAPGTPRIDVSQSRAGVILGTAAYMSPEQARGQDVDRRTDIWSFGCVLFEMLTGHLAFAGDTTSDTIARILEREPEWSRLPASTPKRVRRLLRRCLRKNAAQRLRDVGDARLEIDSAEDPPAPDSGAIAPIAAVATISTGGGAKARAAWGTWMAFAALAAAVAVWEVWRPPIVQEAPLAGAQFSRFTDWAGTESGAEISPDGKFVAFKADLAGRTDVWISQVGTGRFQNLTKDFLPALSPAGIVRTLGFSGDGTEIWFAEGGASSALKYRIPVTGGVPRPFQGPGIAASSWSPDDTRLVYFTDGDGDPLSLADRTSADAKPLRIDTPGFFDSGIHNHNPVWSPDGQWIYFAHGPDPTTEMNLWRVRPGGGTPEPLTALHAAANHLALIDARTVLYVAPADDGSGPWLWSLDVETRMTRRVVSGVEHYSSVSASRDGRRVVATVWNPTASVWRVPVLDRPAEDRDVQPYELPGTRARAPRVSGTSLYYLAGQGAGDGLLRIQDGKAFEVWKGDNDALSEPAAVSRDGTRVAIIVRRQGKLALVVIAADGTLPTTLARSITIQSSRGHGAADWSADGKSIVAAGTDANGSGLFIIPLSGEAPVRLVSGDVVNPVWSPDGSLIVYGGAVVGGRVPLLGVRPDGTPVELPDVGTGIGGAHRFLPDGNLVYVPRSHPRDFWLLDFATKQTRALTHLSDLGVMNAFDITPDGTAIVFDRQRNNSDIVLIDLPKAK